MKENPELWTVRYTRIGFRHSKEFESCEPAVDWANRLFLSAAEDVVVRHNDSDVYSPKEANPEGQMEGGSG